MEGKIKTLATDTATGNRKGFGFIEPAAGGKEVFFHRTACVGCRYDELNEGDEVAYDPGTGDKGPRAENVRLR